VDWLIERAKRTPFVHLKSKGDVYMYRYWLFNPYPNGSASNRKWWQFPISIRLHHIKRKDLDEHLHDHPWNARTFILRGWCTELREDGNVYCRSAGDTVRLKFGEFHRITDVSEEGVWTLFITGRHMGTWGFKVNGSKVPWRKYMED
jgi:hypothetical protein